MDFNGMFNGMFGKLANGMARLSMNGGIAIKTSTGYKTYNMKTGNLVNCANFVFPGAEEFFFVMPTNKVQPGDIIMVSGTPRCVVEVGNKQITVINYENGTVENVLPERHIFMGNTYFYGKIVSMFGTDIAKGKGGVNKLMKYMMLSEMMKGGNGQNNMLPFLLMSNGNMFSDMFDGIDLDEEEETETETE